MKKVILVLLLVFLTWIDGLADISDWTTFTNAQDVRDFVISDNMLWAGTNGGLLTLDTQTLEFTKYTNIDGLKDISLTAIDVDKYDNVWVALENGVIQRFSPLTNTWELVSDYEGFAINDLYTIGDSVFVALNIGISLYDSYRWEVKETWKIGDVNELTIVNREIWAATKAGMKMASLDFPNLIAPSAWTTFTTSSGLPGNEVFSVYGNQDAIVAGTSNGIALYKNNEWGDSAFAGDSVYAITVWNDQFTISDDDAIYTFNNETGWHQLGGGLSNVKNIYVDSQGRLWVEQGDNALYVYDNNTWTHHMPNGPVTNNFSSVVVDQTGNLWAASAGKGLSLYNGTEWINFTTRNSSLGTNDFRDLEVDRQNRVWAGSFGHGVYIFTPNEDGTFSITNLYKDHFSGSSAQNPNYVATHRIKMDAQGNMWIMNYTALNNNPIAVVDSTLERWQYFSVADGFYDKVINAIEFDQYGRKWFGTKSNGVFVLDDNNTPFDKSDDEFEGTISTSDDLVSNDVTSLAMDLDYVMYIGTPEGINTYFSGELSEYLDNRVINSYINTILLDGVNNKWVGTSGGLSMLHSDGFDTTHYVSSTHPLVSDNVTSLAFNEETGDLYIGTTNGLSRFITPYTRPKENLNYVKGYPNPFILESEMSKFYIDNLGVESSVRIFTAEGFLVKNLNEKEVLGSRAIWDGKNEQGEWVASGVYIYQIITRDGDTTVGKVAVIHP